MELFPHATGVTGTRNPNYNHSCLPLCCFVKADVPGHDSLVVLNVKYTPPINESGGFEVGYDVIRVSRCRGGCSELRARCHGKQSAVDRQLNAWGSQEGENHRIRVVAPSNP